jgi:hypothetical protein
MLAESCFQLRHLNILNMSRELRESLDANGSYYHGYVYRMQRSSCFQINTGLKVRQQIYEQSLIRSLQKRNSNNLRFYCVIFTRTFLYV